MIFKHFKLSLILFSFVLLNAEQQINPKIGYLTLKDGLGETSIPYLIPLIELFQNDEVKTIILSFECGHNLLGYDRAFALARNIKHLKRIYNKPIIAYSDEWLTRSEYALACCADYIMVCPLCFIGNISCSSTFPDQSKKNFNEGMIEHPICSGKFKYFADPNHPISQQDVAKLQNELEEDWRKIINEITKLRPQLKNAKNKWINGEIYSTNQLQEDYKFFVDKLGDKIDLLNFAKSLIQSNTIDIVQKESNKKIDNVQLNDQKENKIVILNIDDKLKWKDSDHYLKIVEESFRNEKNVGILLNIYCTGADSGSLMYNLFSQFNKLKKLYNKKVVSFIDGYALSGGYWLACCGDYIVSSPISLIGSIGYRFGRYDYTKKDQLDNIVYHVLTTNKFGNLFNVHTTLTNDEKLQIQKMISGNHKGFIDQVKESRPQLANCEAQWTEAQSLNAKKALKIGMIDQIGCQMNAIKYLIKDASLSDYTLVFKNFNKEQSAQN